MAVETDYNTHPIRGKYISNTECEYLEENLNAQSWKSTGCHQQKPY